jgi:phosphate/sulfate permease
MPEFLSGVDPTTATLLIVGLAIAFLFEFVNGFHDTANAVATVIYTRALQPTHAVVWSGIWNALGVLHASATGLVVAFSIVHLLPVELLVGLGATAGIAMVFALLLAAVIWNLGTWLLGLPASSSHSLIGAVLGVGLAASIDTPGGFGSGVNWAKAGQVLLSLVISPVVGFGLGMVCLHIARRLMPAPHLHEPASSTSAPPRSVRALLILACTGVSFAHGSNDGQKGVGLIMLILIGILPATFALNTAATPEVIATARTSVVGLRSAFEAEAQRGVQAVERDGVDTTDHPDWKHIRLVNAALPDSTVTAITELTRLGQLLEGRTSLADIPAEQRWELRSDILKLRQVVLDYTSTNAEALGPAKVAELRDEQARLARLTEYAPDWVPIGVALALGLGTMIGWKRIVKTVGEKIGTTPMSYAQGTTAQLVTAGTILTADLGGAPVSTTHILSSSVAGSLKAGGAALQPATLRSIALAWVLTLPVSMLLGAVLFRLAVAFTR